MDRVLSAGHAHLLVGLGAALLLLPPVIGLCQFLQAITIAYVGQRFVFDVRVTIHAHLLRLSLRFFGNNSVGKLINRLMGDSGTVQQMISGQAVQVLSDMVSSVFALTVIFMLNWRLSLLLLLFLVAFVVNFRISVQKIRRYTRGYRQAVDRLSGSIQNRLSGSLTVKTFGAEMREQDAFRSESWSSLDLAEDAQVASVGFHMNTQLVQEIGHAVLYLLACGAVLRGTMTYGDVLAFSAYAMQLLGPAVNLSSLAEQFQHVGIAIERLFELHREEPEVSDRAGAAAPDRIRGQVDFHDVGFFYDEGVPVLEGFDLHVAAGETVALIGPTGCGKSTIISLILLFYDVKSGSLQIDGRDIRDIRLGSLRRRLGIVLQEPLLFETSLFQNIRYGRPEAGSEDVIAAAKVAEIHDFITSLPEGYETVLGHGGVDLSVGQKQRITIARAVLADPAILIMDEATSALDSDSERAIQRAMERVLEGRTSFIVAHRLSTIRHADRIVLLDKGRIREMGRHDELMNIPGGGYQGLYTRHMGKGVLGDET